MKKFFDRRCPECGWVRIDSFEPSEAPIILCDDCGEPTERAWLTKASNVIGDAMDWTQRNGTKIPIHFTSKQERKRWMKQEGWREADYHMGDQGSDKNKFTQPWATMSQETLDGAKAMLERVATQSSWRDVEDAPIGITSQDGLHRYLREHRNDAPTKTTANIRFYNEHDPTHYEDGGRVSGRPVHGR